MGVEVSATVITEEMGRKLEGATLEDLGTAARVVSTKDDTTIVDGEGNDKAIKARIDEISTEIDKSTSNYDKETRNKCLAKMASG